jgi:hypothetical protein
MTNDCLNAGQNVPGASNALRRANFRYRDVGAATSLAFSVGFNTVAIFIAPVDVEQQGYTKTKTIRAESRRRKGI